MPPSFMPLDVCLANDPEAQAWHVSDTDFLGLVLEEADPGRPSFRHRLLQSERCLPLKDRYSRRSRAKARRACIAPWRRQSGTAG
jgi:hypothetical protein